jgi:cytochrome c oxidase subunit 2
MRVRTTAILSAGSLFLSAISAGSRPMPARETTHAVQVVARKFSFEPSLIEVTAGETVRLVMHSVDGVHGLSIRRLKMAMRIPATGEAVTFQFTAPPPGRYDIECSEFCGSGHGQMKAVLVSVPPRSVELP